MAPVRQQGFGVGSEHLADVGGVVERAVEVDVVGNRDRLVHDDLVHRDQPRLHHAPFRLVAEQSGDPPPHRGPGLPSRGQEGVEVGGFEEVRDLEHLGGRDGGEVKHVITDAHSDPSGLVAVGKDAVGKVVDVVQGAGRPVHPRRRLGGLVRLFPQVDSIGSWASRPRLARSWRGSCTLHDPNEVNQPRAETRPASPTSSSSSVAVAASVSSSRCATCGGLEPSRLARVASRTLRKPWCSKPVSLSRWRTAWCSPAVHLNASSRSSADSMQVASSDDAGKSSAFSPPVRNFSRRSRAAISSSAACHDWVGGWPNRRGGSTYTGRLSSRWPLSTSWSVAVTSRRALCARSASSRSANSSDCSVSSSASVAHRTAGSSAPTPPVTITVTGRLSENGVARRVLSRSGRVTSRTTNVPTRSAYAAWLCSRWPTTASARGAFPGGNMAASSTSER